MASDLDELEIDILRQLTEPIRYSMIVKNLRPKYKHTYKSVESRALDVKVAQKLKQLKDMVNKDDRGYSGGVWYSINAEGSKELARVGVEHDVSTNLAGMSQEQIQKFTRDLESLGMKMTFEENAPIFNLKTKEKIAEFTGLVGWKKKE